MSPLQAKVLSVVAVLGVAVPATAHSVHTRLEERRSARELSELTASIGPIARAAAGARRVTLNGAEVSFRQSREQAPVGEVMARVARDCASGDRDTALAHEREGGRDGASRGLELLRVVTEEAASGEQASLCIFAPEKPSADELAGTFGAPMHRVRYTLARQLDDGSTAVTTVVHASETPLAALFPTEGDAPGSDLPEIARPASSRRTLTAIVGDGAHAVRVYESAQPLEQAVASYDAAMRERGFVTTASLRDARMYRRDGRSYVASFLATTTGSAVTLTPFGDVTAPFH